MMNPFRNGLRALLAAVLAMSAHGSLTQAATETPAAPADKTQAPTGGWAFYNGAEFPGATGDLSVDANGRVTMNFSFAGGGNYVSAIATFDPPVYADHISARIKKPFNAEMTVRMVDSTNQTFQKPFYFDSDQWRKVDFNVDGFIASYGGAADGTFHQPIKSFALLAENRGIEDTDNQIQIEDVQAHLFDPNAPGGPGDQAYDQGTSDVSYLVTDFKNVPLMAMQGPASYDTATGRWHADFSKGGHAEVEQSISLLGDPKALELVVRGGNPGNLLIMHIGSHFQTFGRAVGVLDGKEQTFRLTMPPEGWDYWGGENDGVPIKPLRLSGFALSRENGPAEAADVELVSLKCLTSVPNAKAVNLSSGISAHASQGIAPLDFTTTVTGRNLLEKPVKGTLSLKVLDWDENVVYENQREVTMPAGGEPHAEVLDFSIPRQLLFLEATATFEAEGQHPADCVATWTSPVTSAGDTTLKPDLPWGMGVYLYRYDLSPSGLARMEMAAEMAQRAGVKWTREEFSWGRLEPKRGQFDFSYYDKMVDTALAHGISVYGLLAYWSDFTKPYTEEGIDDFVTYARAMVRHFKGRVNNWEIYNEPNIFFWQGPKELYPVLVERCYKAIKEEDPNAKVLAGSTSGIDRGFIDQLVKSGAPFDILTIHPYRGSLSEIQFINELRATSRLVGSRPVWITEMGWPTQIGGTSQREQAEYLGRCYLSMALSGVCQNMGWYNFRNDGIDPYYNEHNFGVLNFDLSPKPAYRALATVCNSMASGTPKQRTDFGPDVWAVEMGGTLALWSNRGDYKIRARVLDGQPKVVNLMGDPLDAQPGDGALTLTIESKKPVFISGGTVEAAGPAEAIDKGQNDILRF